jgi:hypothetical protein
VNRRNSSVLRRLDRLACDHVLSRRTPRTLHLGQRRHVRRVGGGKRINETLRRRRGWRGWRGVLLSENVCRFGTATIHPPG